MKWTTAQNNAIKAKNSRLLVSAAAGSGKTAVLVERLLEKLEEPGIDINDFLLVTFTEAAAAEMREKIAVALERKIEDDFDFSRQLSLLPDASISTVHSFCSKLIRQYFYLLDISPDIKQIEENEALLIRDEALQSVVEKWYDKEDEEYIVEALEIFNKGETDNGIIDTLNEIFKFLSSHPYPLQWLETHLKDFELTDKAKIGDTPFVKALLKQCQSIIDALLPLSQSAAILCNTDDVLSVKYLPSINEFDDLLKKLKVANGEKDYNAMQKLLTAFVNPRLSSSKGCDERIKAQVVSIRDIIKNAVGKMRDDFFFVKEGNFNDAARTYKVVEVLFAMTRDYIVAYSEEKRRRNVMDFSDLEHKALQLLIEEYDLKADTYKLTPIAESISQDFHEIIVDEYQDTNLTQDLIFRAISKNEQNIFMVGDVKQSIYRFRQAEPEIFLRYKNTFMPFIEGEDNSEPRVINLDKNFRSRKSVVDTVNFIFRNIMSESLGGLDYTESEELKQVAEYSADTDNTYQSELVIVQDSLDDSESLDADGVVEVVEAGEMMESGEFDGESESRIVSEAKYVAARIKRMVNSNFPVNSSGDGEKRPMRFSDVAILVRKNSYVNIFERELVQIGVPVISEQSESYFNTPEVMTMLSLLKIINNPFDDVSFVAVLKSPIFGWTVDEITSLRVNCKELSIYEGIMATDNEKCKAVADFLIKYQTLKTELPVDVLIWNIYQESGYLIISSGMPRSELRRANLQLLYENAGKFEEGSFKGLHNFVDYIDKFIERNQDMESAKILDDNENCVRIMTIHKSKGLEFPVCFVCGLSSQFSAAVTKKQLLLDRELGLGFIMRDENLIAFYDTLHRRAIMNKIRHDDLSEEVRVLYVALTRAKEKLIMTMNTKSYSDLLDKCTLPANDKSAGYVLTTMNCLGKWILSVIKSYGAENIAVKVLEVKDILRDYKSYEWVGTNTESNIDDENNAEYLKNDENSEFLGKIREMLNFKYEFIGSSNIPSKLTVTELKEKRRQQLDEYKEYNISELYQVDMDKTATSGIKRGNAYHIFMELCDYSRDFTGPNAVADEIIRLQKNGGLSEEYAQTLNIKTLEKFLMSNLYSKIKNAKTFVRERKFNVLLPVVDLLPEYKGTNLSGEQVILQGVFDLVFENNDGTLSIVDFKSDRVDNADVLLKRYSEQLKLYGLALESFSERPVSALYLYSFGLGEIIQVKI